MERNVRILHASVNPGMYNLTELASMGFDEALDFFNNDNVRCCSYEVETVDLSRPNEFTFHADGVCVGDGSDTMLNWCKVE